MKASVIIVILVLLSVGYRVATTRSARKPLAAPGEASNQPKVLAELSQKPLIQELESSAPDRFRMAVVSGKDALLAIATLDSLGKKSGWHAVFIGAKSDLPEFDADLANGQSPQDILSEANKIDAVALLKARRDEATESDEGEVSLVELLGEWPEQSSASALPAPYAVFRDVLTQNFHDRVYIALVPAEEAWQIPAYLQNGSWNEVPSPAEQVAVLKYWHETYGATLRTFSSDVMELEVARPPQGREAALILAEQQFGFCTDIVWQGVGAIRPLAAALDKANHWYFWWD
jgi:Domain of unknown function (DUF4253)